MPFNFKKFINLNYHCSIMEKANFKILAFSMVLQWYIRLRVTNQECFRLQIESRSNFSLRTNFGFKIILSNFAVSNLVNMMFLPGYYLVFSHTLGIRWEVHVHTNVSGYKLPSRTNSFVSRGTTTFLNERTASCTCIFSCFRKVDSSFLLTDMQQII